MKVSDYIVEYIISKGIEDVFGYPGGMVTHLMDSFRKYPDKITAHVTYHEQGAAFAACGYAQVTGKPGIAYATSGPGATNLITGICNAFFDSIPCVFITGQVNTFESKDVLGVRQRGFQETNIVDMVKTVTKFAVYVESPEKIKFYLDKAFFEAMNGRRGPVLLDIPMNIFRSEIDETTLIGYQEENICYQQDLTELFDYYLKKAQRPVMLLGNGIKLTSASELVKPIISKLGIPVVTSMIAIDAIIEKEYNLGFIGAYGDRVANFAVAKCDLLITLGTRLDVRQVGAKRENFAPKAQILRIDVDQNELQYKIRDDEIDVCCTINEALKALENVKTNDYSEWKNVCKKLKSELEGFDSRRPNELMKQVSQLIDTNTIITTDVGQNQVWVAQSFELKKGQKILFSGGHGAMGYSLPAAIGAYYGIPSKPVICITGDGGLQMNIQELQLVARERIPIKIIVFNNNALGMIRHFQEMYFDSNYYQTKPEGGYEAPCFAQIAGAYGIRSERISNISELSDVSLLTNDIPFLLEIVVDEDTYVFPKLEFGKPNQDQEPLLPREQYERLMDL